MIGKLLESLYTKVFINIIVQNLQTIVYIEVCSRKKVEQSLHRTFETTAINAKMYEFINAYYKASPFCYISILDKSSSQGAIPTCSVSEMAKYCDISSSEHKCYSKDWAYYTSEYDLEAMKHDYRSIGVDFIFSPFVLLANFFKDKIENTLSIFVLLEDSAISFTIFEDTKLLYAEYLNMQRYKNNEDILIDISLDDDDDVMEGIDLEEITIEEGISEFDDFTNIEDLDDDGGGIDEFSESAELEEVNRAEESGNISDSGFNEDYQRFTLIQSALNTFYKDPKYKSQFIETIYIADGVGVSSDLKSYLEEEIFLSVFIRKIDLGSALCDMAKAEI